MDYTKYMQKGLRHIVRDILTEVVQNGITENQCYYITFQTDRKDVVIPDFVRARYPKEMTIILQHQFENLGVTEQKIMVDLTFGGVLSTLIIPLTALKQFADPSAEFGLLLTPETEEPLLENQPNTADPSHIIDLNLWRKK